MLLSKRVQKELIEKKKNLPILLLLGHWHHATARDLPVVIFFFFVNLWIQAFHICSIVSVRFSVGGLGSLFRNWLGVCSFFGLSFVGFDLLENDIFHGRISVEFVLNGLLLRGRWTDVLLGVSLRQSSGFRVFVSTDDGVVLVLPSATRETLSEKL